MTLHKPTSSESQGTFARGQAEWAARGIPTFPIKAVMEQGKWRKKPLIRNYGRIGLPASAQVARKQPDALAYGFMAGKRNGIFVIDVDVSQANGGERILADAMLRHGEAKVVIQTASTKFHGYYKYNGEGRHVRPDPKLEIDLLGDGMVVAPTSRIGDGTYTIIQGHMDDLDRLTVAKGLDQLLPPKGPKLSRDTGNAKADISGPVDDGRRGVTAFRYCMEQARSCDDLAAMIDVAFKFNENCEPPMEETRVIATATDAWNYEERGMNYVGQHVICFANGEYSRLAQENADAASLLAVLREANGPTAKFWISNGMAELFGPPWTRKRFAAARCTLIQRNFVEMIKRAAPGSPALYRWAIRR